MTSRRCCASRRHSTRRCASTASILDCRDPRKQHVGETEAPEIADTHRVENAVEMIALVLHDARVKALDVALDDRARRVETAIAQSPKAGHDAAQPRNRQAALPPVLELVGQRDQYRIDELRV